MSSTLSYKKHLDIFKISLHAVAPELEVKGKNLYLIDKNTMKCYIDEGATLNLTCRMVAASPMTSAEWEGRGTATLQKISLLDNTKRKV